MVIDTGIADKWLVPEIHSEAALRLRDPRFRLHASDLCKPGFTDILWKNVQTGFSEDSDTAPLLHVGRAAELFLGGNRSGT